MTNVNLSEDALTQLQEFARDRGITLNTALRMAIANQYYFHNKLKNGGTILILEADKTINEVVFR